MNTLIGHTGFVGGSLTRQASFDAYFNSKNIADIGGAPCDLAVCAAAPGSMFKANRFPDADRDNINRLTQGLKKLDAQRFVLISTIAVFADSFAGCDEDATDYQVDLAYGRHRRELEIFVQETFPESLIVRLPALFGPGLRKNFLFDLLNPAPSMLTKAAFSNLCTSFPEFLQLLESVYTFDDGHGLFVVDRDVLSKSTERSRFENSLLESGLSSARFTNPQSTFQFYDMNRLWRDITVGLNAGLDMMHLCPEPVSAGEIFQSVIGQIMPDAGAKPYHEDMRTLHGSLFRRSGHYIASRTEVSDSVKAFMHEGASQ